MSPFKIWMLVVSLCFFLSDATEEVKKVKKVETAIDEISVIAKDMEGAGALKGDKKGTTLSNTITAVKTKAKGFDKKKRSEMGQTANDVIDGTSDGLSQLVGGIQSGSWQDVVMGGLALIGAISAMMGPAGMLFSIGLSIFSMLFGMFGGATGGEESTEDMVKRLLDSALVDQRADELRAESTGLKKLFGSLSKSIANFRKSGDISEQQAVQFYNEAFTGVDFFGVLEYYIDKWCNIGDANDFAEKQDELNKNSDRCLEFVNLYCDLSILRQLLVADMASFMTENNLAATAKTLLTLVAKEQRSDMDLLRFVYDPINFKNQRYVDAKYYSAVEKYATLTNYLKKLESISMMETEENSDPAIIPQKLMKEMVMQCTDSQLKNDCFENKAIGKFNKVNLNDWGTKMQSFYLSTDRMLTGFRTENFGGAKYGPYYGPGLYTVTNLEKSFKSFEIKKNDKKEVKMLRVCEKENMDSSGECEVFPEGNYTKLYDAKTTSTIDGSGSCIFPFKRKANYRPHDECTRLDQTDNQFWCATVLNSEGVWSSWNFCLLGKNWEDRITSMSIPAGMMVTGYDNEDYTGTAYGPFYGPDTISKLHKPNTWSSITFMPTKTSTTAMIKICGGVNLGGYCDYLDPPKQKNVYSENYKLNSYHGADWSTTTLGIKSIKIPAGIKVWLYSTVDNRGGNKFGPYLGPITVNKVDGTENDGSIKSIVSKRYY